MMPVAGLLRHTVTKDLPVTSHQSHIGSAEPVESRCSSVQTQRTSSEPIRKPSHQPWDQQHYALSAAGLKVASVGSLDVGRIKKPKSGTEMFMLKSLCLIAAIVVAGLPLVWKTWKCQGI